MKVPAALCLFTVALCFGLVPEASGASCAKFEDLPAKTAALSAAATDPAAESCRKNSPQILEVYYGLDMLPMQANFLCGSNVAGLDGMPVTFSVQLEGSSVSPDDFVVETADGQRVTPNCATLQPAVEPLERRTVLLAGNFGSPAAQPRAVEVVGTIQDLSGNSFTGLRSNRVTPLEAGPSIVLAERYVRGNPGLGGECPAEASQVIQLVWAGGVTGPQRAALGEPQRLGVSVRLQDGSTVQPIALADDDPDNFVYACLAASSPGLEVRVAPGLFHDPGNDSNPATSAAVINRAFTINRGIDGSWYNPATNGQGLLVEVSAASNVMVFGWFTYTDDGKLDWMYGNGTYTDNVAEMSVFRSRNGRFNNPAFPVTTTLAGDATFTLIDCTHALFDFVTTDPSRSGRIELIKLLPAGSECVNPGTQQKNPG